MICERCNAIAGEPVVARVRSDVIDLKVCRHCAKAARDLGLVIEPLAAHSPAEQGKSVRAAA
jgi:hypothetical protein